MDYSMVIAAQSLGKTTRRSGTKRDEDKFYKDHAFDRISGARDLLNKSWKLVRSIRVNWAPADRLLVRDA